MSFKCDQLSEQDGHQHCFKLFSRMLLVVFYVSMCVLYCTVYMCECVLMCVVMNISCLTDTHGWLLGNGYYGVVVHV